METEFEQKMTKCVKNWTVPVKNIHIYIVNLVKLSKKKKRDTHLFKLLAQTTVENNFYIVHNHKLLLNLMKDQHYFYTHKCTFL